MAKTTPTPTEYTITHPEVLAYCAKTGSDPASAATAMRLSAATKEATALKEWQRAGVGEPPAIPNLTAIRQGATIMKTKNRSTAARTERACEYTKNGQRPNQKKPWTLGYVAYFCTAGIDKKSPARITTTALEALLKKLGVDDPRQPGWEVELPNGVKVGAVKLGTLGYGTDQPVKAAKATGGKQLVPSPKARVARKSADTRAKTAARKSRATASTTERKAS